MPSPDTIHVLNRVLAILERSFPQYLRYARPYIPQGREKIMQTIHQIVAGQDALAQRGVSQQVFESGGLPDNGDFPIEFTDTHDLGIDFLVQEAVDCLKENVAELQTCNDALRFTAAQSLASEALGLVKGHMELLQEIATGNATPAKNGAVPP